MYSIGNLYYVQIANRLYDYDINNERYEIEISKQIRNISNT